MTDNKKPRCIGSTSRSSKMTSESSRQEDTNTLSTMDVLDAFRDVLVANGAIINSIIPDAGIQRVKSKGDKGSSRSFWYSLHTDGAIPAGSYGCFKKGLAERWHIKKDNKPLTDVERRELAQTYENAKRKREVETQAKYKKARMIACATWNKAQPARPDHPYLVKKHCEGASQYLKTDKRGNLIVPIFNSKRLVSIQYIHSTNFGKWFLKGSELRGSFFMFGDIKNPFSVVQICEGISTGWVIKTLSTNNIVLCAMNAGNLKNVAISARNRWKNKDIIICADNDVRDTPDQANTGIVAANDAALAINGRISIPSLPTGEKCDFNDLYVLAIESHQKENARASK